MIRREAKGSPDYVLWSLVKETERIKPGETAAPTYHYIFNYKNSWHMAGHNKVLDLVLK